VSPDAISMIGFIASLPLLVKLIIGVNYAFAGYMYIAPPIIIVADIEQDAINIAPVIVIDTEVFYSNRFNEVLKVEYGKYLQSAYYTPIGRALLSLLADGWSLLTGSTDNNFLLKEVYDNIDILVPPKIIIIGDLKFPYIRGL